MRVGCYNYVGEWAKFLQPNNTATVWFLMKLLWKNAAPCLPRSHSITCCTETSASPPREVLTLIKGSVTSQECSERGLRKVSSTGYIYICANSGLYLYWPHLNNTVAKCAEPKIRKHTLSYIFIYKFTPYTDADYITVSYTAPPRTS